MRKKKQAAPLTAKQERARAFAVLADDACAPGQRRHAYRHTSWSGNGKHVVLYFQCQHCPSSKSRMAGPIERREWRANNPLTARTRATNIHYVWHKFQHAFLQRDEQGNVDPYANDWTFHGGANWAGVERFAKRYPNDVWLVRCDDAHHASSDLILVDHKTRDQYMGTTVVYVPQCTGEKPIQFFLYPSHRFRLAGALDTISRLAKPVTRRERVALLQQSKRSRSYRLERPR